MKRKIILLALIPLLAGCGADKPVDPTPTPTPTPTPEKEKYGPCDETYYYLTKNINDRGEFTVAYSDDFKTITQTYSVGSRCIIKLNDKYYIDEIDYYDDSKDLSLLSIYTKYEYNSLDLETKEDTYYLIDEEMVLTDSRTKEYDDQGRIVNEVTSYLNEDTGLLEPTYQYEYKYEENTVFESYFYYEEGQKDFVACYKAVDEIHESTNELVTNIYYTDDKNLINFQSIGIETYDLTTGLMKRYDYFDELGNPCSYAYTYNKNGDRLECIEVDADYTRTYRNNYDEETGFIISNSYLLVENATSQTIVEKRETHTVDENGVIIATHGVEFYNGVNSREYDFTYESIAVNYNLPDNIYFLARFPGHYNDQRNSSN